MKRGFVARARAFACTVVGAFACAAAWGAPAGAAGGGVTRWVDPFIGSDGTGHTTPAAAVPFGMVMPGPDNAGTGWSYSSGYQFRAPKILGFSNTHISGAGIPELGDLLLMPSQGRGWSAATADFASGYDKRDEAARPGWYAVTLRENRVRVELTATQRVALHRYTFARPGRVQVLVDLQHGLVFGEQPRVREAQARIEGREARGTLQLSGWVQRQASFVLRFDRAPRQVTLLPARAGPNGDKAPRWLLDFDLGAGRTLQARVALSTVDEDGAERNLREADGRAFDTVRRDADRAWNALLGRLRLAPGESARTQRLFYSALYRALLHPSDIADADGRVRGPRGGVIQAPGGRYDSTLSLWDTFRAVHPLHTLLVPERVPGYVNTFLAHHAQQGYLPLWTAWGRETHTMIGNPALPVMADAVVKGFGGFDRDAALRAMVETSTRARPDAPAWAQRDWSVLERYGWLPFDIQPGESVSKTAEYGWGDDALARVARALGDAATAERFARRAQGWRHLFDATTLTLRGKDSAGRWREPFNPVEATSPLNNPGDYTEANAWQYTATPALHDPEGFRELLGGPKALEDWLDTFFATPLPNPDKHLGQEALIGQYAHGNEPSHHIAWLYAYTDTPAARAKGQALVRRIAREFYADTPKGLIGNDDCGQMSAWLVFAMLGLYPAVPASGSYVAGVPMVQGATLRLPGGRMLRIEPGRVDQPSLDGRPLPPTAMPHASLVQGGTLRLPARP
jgi:predicted alpha-1,2-mannosidase